MPGLTETSLLPQAADAAGIDFDELLERILASAWTRAQRALQGAQRRGVLTASEGRSPAGVAGGEVLRARRRRGTP